MSALEEIQGKVIFPIVDDIRYHSYKLDDNYDKLDSRIQPLTRGHIAQLIEAGYKCPDVTAGSKLMLHPYRPKTMVPFSTNTFDYICEKLSDYSVILNLLGAKKQNLCAKCEEVRKRDITAEGKAKIKGLDISGRFRRVQINKQYSKREITIEAGDPNWSYDNALEKAVEFGLDKDPFIKSMLEKRNVRPIDHYTEQVEIGKDYNDIMDVAANMNVMKGPFNLDGNFKQELSIVQKVYINQDIYFIK